MNQTTIYLIATGLILAGLVLLVVGLPGPTWMWQVGLAAVAIAMAMALYTHWVPDEDDDEPQSGAGEDKPANQ